MEIISILLIVLTGIVIYSSIQRIWGDLENDIIVETSLVSTFGSVVLTLMMFRNLGLIGIFFTVTATILLQFVYVKFHVRSDRVRGKDQKIWGGGYWITLLSFFTVAGLKSGIISTYVNEVYMINSSTLSFYVVLGLVVLAGSVSMLMLIREIGSKEHSGGLH